jgi:succinate dehydrogenase flavin-adding protein (antitoxin of CptAB toxin-antitoxin module)
MQERFLQMSRLKGMKHNGIISEVRYSGGKLSATGSYQSEETPPDEEGTATTADIVVPNVPVYRFKKIVLDISGLDETDVIQAEHSPQRITKLSSKGLRQWVSMMDEADLREFPKWINLLIAQLKEALTMMEQKKVSRAKYGR